jgi:hypothetical protein
MSNYEVDGVVFDRQPESVGDSRPTCAVTHREIQAGDACVMLLAEAPAARSPSGPKADGLSRRRYLAPPILGESDGEGWLTWAVGDESREFMLFAVGGTDWETARQVQRAGKLQVADGGFVSWHATPVPARPVFVMRRAWYELLDNAVDVFPLQMRGVSVQAEDALRVLCRPTFTNRLPRRPGESLPIANAAVVKQILRDSAFLDVHPNTRTALWWYAQLGMQAGCSSETRVEQLISRFVQQAIFQRALSWLA